MKVAAKKAFRLNRLFSTPLSSLFLRLPVTPNQVTCASLACGVIAGFLFFSGTYISTLAGATLYLFACILDNCDGDIARAKSLGSEFGAWFDIVADYACDLSLFLGLGFGMLKSGFHGGTALALGLCVVGGWLHLGLVWAEKKRGFGPAQFDAPNKSDKPGLIRTVFDALREGDSAWLVLAFALVGKAHTLVYFGAAYLFFVAGAAIWVNRRHLARPA